MKNSGIENSVFQQAVEAVTSGNISNLETLIAAHPGLLSERFLNGEEGYFQDPYLLYYVADNPIRVGALPSNIVELTAFLIDKIRKVGIDSLQQQLNYTLGLVVTDRTPKDSGVQIRMMDLLVESGAEPNGLLGALAYENIAAAKHLLALGTPLTLPAAVGLGLMGNTVRLVPESDQDEKLLALTVACFYGKEDMVSFLLNTGVNPNGYPKNEGFHSHATPLHQAVFSGSLSSVKLLVEAGAALHLTDKVYGGTPLDWAQHMQTENALDYSRKKKFAVIGDYLRR